MAVSAKTTARTDSPRWTLSNHPSGQASAFGESEFVTQAMASGGASSTGGPRQVRLLPPCHLKARARNTGEKGH